MTPAGVDQGPAPHARAARVGRARRTIPRERLAPLWLLGSLILATIGALLVLYPKAYIEANLTATRMPNTASLAYLRLLVRAHSDEPAARILLAEQALTVGDIDLSHRALAPWLHGSLRHVPLQIAMLRLHLLEAELRAASRRPEQRGRLAAIYARDAADIAPRMRMPALTDTIRMLTGLGQFDTVTVLYRDMIDRARNQAARRHGFLGGIAALLAAGRPQAALNFARSELDRVQPDDVIWRHMIRLALMADQPVLAAHYARRLVGMSRK